MATFSPTKEAIVRSALIVGSVGLALLVAELIGRALFIDTPYVPGPQIDTVQQQMVADPRVGFLWRPNVHPEQGIVIEWSDAEPWALSTDTWGFINVPEAIEALAANGRADVVGLGDSFMQIAAEAFFERFRDAGLQYYSLAMHHQGPPQYNRILIDHALSLDPSIVLYAVSENDLADTYDFELWNASGVDWFTFHSGSWCGPPSSGSPALDRLRTMFRGSWASWRALRWALGSGRPRAEPGVVRDYVLSAREAAEAAGTRFVVLILPSKATALSHPTPDALQQETLAGMLRKSGVEIVDLRAALASPPGSTPLFYARDSHWNRAGQRLAADRVLSSLRRRASHGR